MEKEAEDQCFEEKEIDAIKFDFVFYETKAPRMIFAGLFDISNPSRLIQQKSFF